MAGVSWNICFDNEISDGFVSSTAAAVVEVAVTDEVIGIAGGTDILLVRTGAVAVAVVVAVEVAVAAEDCDDDDDDDDDNNKPRVAFGGGIS
jgi:hypothetical protein